MQQRTCVGCKSASPGSAGRPQTGQSAESQAELVRLIVAPEGDVVVDLAGGAFGRGAWVHVAPECLQKAAPAGLSRSFHREIKLTSAELCDRLALAGERRAQGLLLAARRSRKLEFGGAAVEEAVLTHRAELVLVACDARAAAEFNWLVPLVASGRAMAFGSKAAFGKWLGRSETALLAITDPGIARETKQAISLTMLERPNAPRTGTRRAASREAG